MKKSVLAGVLLCAMGLPLLASCQSEAQPKQEDTAAAQTSQTETETGSKYGDKLPDGLDYDGYNFRVLIYDGGNLTQKDGWMDYIDVNEIDGDVLNDAAYERNEEVESRLNVTISCSEDAAWDGVTAQLAKTVMSGDDSYDLAIPCSTDTYTSLISEHMLYDAAQMEYIDFSQPYYTESSYKTYELNGGRYLFSGSFTYPLYSAVSWQFNKDMWADLGYDDPYQTVRDGSWTIDYAETLMKGVYSDVNGDGKQDEGDVYGFSTQTGMFLYLYPGFGMKGVYLEGDGFSFDYGTERAAAVVEKIIGLRNMSDVFVPSSYSWNNFFNGSSLMLLYGSSLPKLRDLDFDFGFLPMPKYDESQESYSAYMCGGIVCVPCTVTDPQRGGAIIEALFSASERYLKPAYIEKFVESKILRDEGSVEMYNLMLKNATYDFTRYICPNSKVQNYGVVNTLVTKKSTDIASEWAKLEDAVTSSFDEFYDAFIAG